jgi:ribosomal protein S18 acetylase RimI-like enzyme
MSEVTSLRAASDADADAIRALTRAAYAKWVEVAGREPLPMTVDYADAVRRHRFDLLHVGADLAALIETTPQDDWLLIVNVAVLPAFQGRGFAVRLLKLAEDQAASAGLTGARLYTNKLFVENIRLYAALGYTVESEEVVASDVTRVHMVKPRASR